MLVHYFSGITAAKSVKSTMGTSLTVTGALPVVAWISSIVGITYYKVGRTTGTTTGTMTATCVNQVLGSTLGNVMNLCVDEVHALSGGGDSGAPVYYPNGDGTVSMAGTLVGGSSSDYFFTNYARINAVIGTVLPY